MLLLRADATGLSLTCISAVRTFAPALTSALFALSVDRDILGGQLAFVVLSLVGLAGFAASLRVHEARPSWRDDR